MKHPKLTGKMLEGLLDVPDMVIVKTDGGFYINSPRDFFSGSFFTDLVAICNVYGYNFYVSSKENGKLFVNLF